MTAQFKFYLFLKAFSYPSFIPTLPQPPNLVPSSAQHRPYLVLTFLCTSSPFLCSNWCLRLSNYIVGRGNVVSYVLFCGEWHVAEAQKMLNVWFSEWIALGLLFLTLWIPFSFCWHTISSDTLIQLIADTIVYGNAFLCRILMGIKQ